MYIGICFYCVFFLPLVNQESKQQENSPDESDVKDLQVMFWGVHYMECIFYILMYKVILINW